MENNASSPIDEPLQLIEFIRNDNEGNTTIKLREDTFKVISEKAGSRPLSTICICGPSRQGKSFMLGHMIRCLEALEKEEDDWMDWSNKSKPLEGFKFRNGTTPETQGIWVWSRPFIVKNDEGKEVAVLLIDTQGTCDEFTTNKDMSAIVGLSLLTSSVMIFNCFTNLQEDILTAMNTYTRYGQLALNETNDTPFQKLIFLIRDWNNPDDYHYGGKGGKMFLEEKLRVKDEPPQPVEAKEVRNTIRKCFKELDCFLMPYIGQKGILKNFTGSIAELDTPFAKKMEEFISNLISSESLVIKEILGGIVTASELQSYLENYLEIFNSNDIPSASTMWEATSDVHNTHMMKKAVHKFTEIIKKKLRGKSYLPPDELDTAQSAAEKQALEVFGKARKVGTPEKISEYQEQLEQNLKKERSSIKKQNEEKRNKFLTGVISDATTQFRTLLEDSVPFDDDDPTSFYEDKDISRAASQAKDAAIEEMKLKMDMETTDSINKKIESLEVIMESTLETHINKNLARRAEAEKKITGILEELTTKFEEEIQQFLAGNKFAELNDLRNLQAQITASTLESWKKAKKPGKKDFHQGFQNKLEKELLAASSKTENEQKIQLHECQQNAETLIEKICQEVEESLTEAAEEIEDEEEFREIYEPLKDKILNDFAQIHNPFPVGHSMHEEFNNKLEAQVNSIIEKIEREVVQYQQRVEESYLQAVQTGISHYVTEMKEILSTSEFMSEEDLQVEHDRLVEESLQEFENYEKVGAPDNALDYKLEVQNGIEKEFQSFKEDNTMKRELAKSKAQNCVTECQARYQDVMKAKMDMVRNDDQLEDLHQEALHEARQMLKAKCPGREDSDFLSHYEEELQADIMDTYEELKDLFEMKRGAEDVAVKEVILDCRKHYHDEMQKHCKNTPFIRPKELEAHHKQSVAVVLEKCEKKVHLSAVQKLDLEDEMKALFEKYESENDMKLNYTRGLPPAIGIDLGTTYCCVAVYINGEVIIIPNQKQGNAETTASYVAYNPDGSKTFGDDAKQNAFRNPENTIYDAKRILGRKFNDPELQRDMKFWPFEVKEEDGIPKINVNGKLLFPEQISAVLLEEYRVMAEKHLKLDPGTIKKAVITVPAYFNDGQRQATVDAGELADLEVLTILNEPTAAAIAYSLERFDNAARKVVIFDLGGGTFDCAVLDVTSKNIQALSVNGDTHLGGEDFDQKMMEYCAQVFKDDTGNDLMKGKDSSNKSERYDARRRLRRLQNECEKAKKMLSSAVSATVSLDAMYNGIDLKVKVTREKFEELNEPDFRKAIGIVEEALKDAGLRKEDIEDVVLVGGSTRIPKVQEMLSNYFGGKALNYSIHPDQAVAYGAAVKAAMMNGEQARGTIDFDSIEDVIPLSIGIAVVPNRLSIIIPKNTRLPIKRTEDYRCYHDNQTKCGIRVFQGEDTDDADNNELLGKFSLDGIPPAKAGKEIIDVIMEIDAMGILHVEAVCRSNASSNRITVTENKQRMSAETKKRLLAEANPAG